MDESIKTVSGSCLCGRVRFEVDLPVKWCSHCHCDLCRRAHGASFVTWFGVSKQAFRLHDGQDLQWYASSEEAQRGFCSTCGSTMFFQSFTRWADEMHIALPFVHGDINKKPSIHVYWDRHVPWVEIKDELKKLGGTTGVEAIAGVEAIE